MYSTFFIQIKNVYILVHRPLTIVIDSYQWRGTVHMTLILNKKLK